MATYADVKTQARLILDDQAGDVFTDSVLLGYVNSAQRDMWQRLISYGVKRPTNTASSIAVALGTTETSLTLPTRLLTPMEMWEKGASETDDYYIKMRRVDDLSTDVAGTTIDTWKWEAGAIRLRPVTNNRLVRIQYQEYPANFSADGDVVTPPLAEDYLAYSAAAIAARSRDQRDFANDLIAIALGNLQELINNQVRANQYKLSRPRPYGR